MNPLLKELSNVTLPQPATHLAYNQPALTTSVFRLTALQQFPVDG